MARNFYYGKHADIVAGSANFSTLITGSPTSYGLTAGQATTFGTLNTALQSAYTAAVNPSTRTPVTVEALTLAIKNMRANAILLGKIVYATSTVNDAQLVGLGLLPRPSRTPIPAPSDAPVIDVRSVSGNTVKLRLHAAGDSTRRGKPAGVSGASIFSFVGATPPTEETDWKFEGNASRTNIEVSFPGTTPSGARVWFTAFWYNQRSQRGPAATPVGTNIPGGSAMAA
jgi:hypothetical protein